MILHIPEFKAMAKCNQHLDHAAFDIEIDDDLLVRHGRWIEKVGRAKCSVCGDECWADSAMEYHYCPNCGAKMDLEENNG